MWKSIRRCAGSVFGHAGLHSQALHQAPPSRDGAQRSPTLPKLHIPLPPPRGLPLLQSLSGGLDPGACLAHDLPSHISTLRPPPQAHSQPGPACSLASVPDAGQVLQGLCWPETTPGPQGLWPASSCSRPGPWSRGPGSAPPQVWTRRGSGESQGPPWGPGGAAWPAQLWGGRAGTALGQTFYYKMLQVGAGRLPACGLLIQTLPLMQTLPLRQTCWGGLRAPRIGMEAPLP